MADAVGERLQPPRLLHGIGRADRGVDVNRLDHVGEPGLGDVVVGPESLRLDRRQCPEDRVAHPRLHPRVVQVRELQVVEVDVCVHEREPCHGVSLHPPSKRRDRADATRAA